MPRAYRFLIVAAGGLAILAALSAGAFFGALYAPDYHHQPTQGASDHARAKQSDPAQIDRDRAGLPYAAKRIASAPDPKSSEERENRELAAQEASALWGFWMLGISAVGTLTTIIGTSFLLWQIILTREAVTDTGKATLAMEEQNKIAREAQILEYRPIFVFDRIDVERFQESSLLIRPVWKNIGKIPAQPIETLVSRIYTPGNPRSQDVKAMRASAYRTKADDPSTPNDPIIPNGGEFTGPGLLIDAAKIGTKPKAALPHVEGRPIPQLGANMASNIFGIIYRAGLGQLPGQEWHTESVRGIYPEIEQDGALSTTNIHYAMPMGYPADTMT